LLLEGDTESEVIGPFLKRWLDPRLSRPVGVEPDSFAGWRELVRDAHQRVRLHLTGRHRDEIIAVIGLMDLHGPTFYPPSKQTATERRQWATAHMVRLVDHRLFRMFFAVHELEAWLLSQPDILPAAVRKDLPKKKPETVNFKHPPSAVLDRLYRSRLNRGYRKVGDGAELFRHLDPAQAYKNCPALAEMFDTLLQLAKNAGL
jgi:hypothetical protein